jgi:hypothetical protein
MSNGKVGSDTIESILDGIKDLDPGAAEVVALVEGLLRLVPEALTDVRTLVERIESDGPIAPVVAEDIDKLQTELAQPVKG